MTDSQTLLSEYARTKSEPAFRDLVGRYVDLVYSSALRLVGGDAQLAEDVSQTVFLNLARKAHRLPREVMLGGWLHRDACYAARALMRSERRRQKRERQAMEMSSMEDHSESNLANLAPLLDEAIEELRTEDRAAIVLRFFEQRDFRSIGQALGSNEDAARKRVTRAVEKLHGLLEGRGVSLSVAALGSVLASETLTAAPGGLAASIAGAAFAGAGAGGGLSATLIKLATMTKIQSGVLGAVVLLGTAASVVIYHQARAGIRAQDESLRRQSAELAVQQAENERLKGLAQDSSGANSLGDLVSIRSEVESLRKQTNSLAAGLDARGRLGARDAQEPNGPFSVLQMQEEEKAGNIARMNYLLRWVRACGEFAQKNGNRFPSSFDQARPFLSEGSSGLQTEEAVAESKLAPEQFEILYSGPDTNIASASQVIVMREKQPRRCYSGNWARAYGFADGHSEIHASADGDYDAWEKQKIIMPSQAQ
ncbi:MAG: RNA polymerase sigma factor [Limisphaerales bacterium]